MSDHEPDHRPANSPFSILLVEDNDGDAELVTEYVHELGEDEFIMERATTLATALDRLAGGQFDIVLLDLHLPDSSGVATLTAICDFCRDHNPLVVVLTGLDDAEIAKAAIEDCASEFLIKSDINSRSLLRTLRLAVQKHGRRRVQEIQHREASAPGDVEEARRILRRSNRVAAMGPDESRDEVTGDLTTGLHAAEVVFSDMARKIDAVLADQRTLLGEQRRTRGDIAALTLQGRQSEEANKRRDIEQLKLRTAIVNLRRQVKPLAEIVMGDRRRPGLGTRVDALEGTDRGWRQKAANRQKTVRESLISLIPVIVSAIGTAVVGFITWYVTQSAKK